MACHNFCLTSPLSKPRRKPFGAEIGEEFNPVAFADDVTVIAARKEDYLNAGRVIPNLLGFEMP